MALETGTRHAMTHESPFLRPAVVPDGVFGYGSLMNPATHDYADLRPARLEGWRRRWAHAEGRPAAFLTAERAPGLAIDGAVADVPPVAWPALDAREAAYDRHDVSEALTPPCGRVVVYAVPGARQGPPTARHPVLLELPRRGDPRGHDAPRPRGRDAVLRYHAGLGRGARRPRRPALPARAAAEFGGARLRGRGARPARLATAARLRRARRGPDRGRCRVRSRGSAAWRSAAEARA